MTKNPKPFQTQVAIDVVLLSVVDEALSVLLVTRQWEPYDKFASLPGAFVRAGETTHQAAERVLHEKAGVTSPVYMEQLYTFDASGRDPRGQFPTVTYMTLVSQEQLNITAKPGVQEPHWVALKKLPTLAFDHATIISYAVGRLRAKLEYTNIIYSLLPKRFTLTQLQRAYEIVMGTRLDKRNFRKKYLSLGLIRATSAYERGGQRRPARLYEFKQRKPSELKKFLS